MVSSQAAAPSFCDRVHFRPVLRVGFTKTSLGMCVILLVLYLLCVRVRFRASLTQNFVSFLFLFLRSRALSTRPDGLDVPYILLYLLCVHMRFRMSLTQNFVSFLFLKTHDIIIKRRRIV